ncbi:MAG: quinone-dependent dihydroorotate dehydrogenase [Alphaproteobacteria bacterium]|jgi:dihydroorotate dehydrogenase|nr:quinone-dependent dihydroorotate dehydrogenase [Alphaproteobacteria bacterium]
MTSLADFATHALRRLPAETAHRIAVRALTSGLGPRAPADAATLATKVWGLTFTNPVGIAAGFDKNAEAYAGLLRAGAGFVEVGTVTPRPQAGNPKPRLFRLPADGAVINRMGFNNQGMAAMAKRLERRDCTAGIVGVNIGRNKDGDDSDYVTCFETLAPYADYITVNVSSPNTPGLRDLQARDPLAALIDELQQARNRMGLTLPLLIKIAPDLTAGQRRDIAEVALASGLDGLVVSNTTITRPETLKSPARGEAGGLSGRPLFAPSTALLAEMHDLTGGRLPLIGVGGIANAAEAYAKLCAGASLVQLYTALAFQGPGLIGDIKRGLADKA